VPDENAFRLRAQYPPAEVRSLAESPRIKSHPKLLDAMDTNSHGVALNFKELAGLGLEEAIGLPTLAGQALAKHLIYRDEVRGLGLMWGLDSDREFNDDLLTQLRIFLRHAATTFEHNQLIWEAQRGASELEAVRLATLYLTSSLQLDEVLNAILKGSLTLLPDMLDAHIFLYDGKTLSFGAAMWADGRKGEVWAEPRRDGLTYTVAESGELVVVPDMAQHPLYANAPTDWNGAIIGAPLRIADQVVGVMNIAFQEPRPLNESTLRLVTLLADQAAIAVKNARAHGVAQEEALTDVLTELPNRRAFDKRLAEEIRRSARYKHAFSLVMMDVDGFKRVNDNYGHNVGDRVLRELAECLRYRVRDTDFLARFGGDEFVLILPETNLRDAAVISDKLRAAVDECQHNWPDKQGVNMTLSIGVAGYPRDAVDSQTLIELADKAMYGRKGH
jgi:diguanylate cyclase (GGDEF)-like protein